MFQFVHHVRILAYRCDGAIYGADFAMTPVKVQVYESRGMKNAMYKVGETNLEFTEPMDAHSAMGQYLAREGPGVYHIAFGVDGIEEVAKGLAAKGNTWRKPGGTGRSAEGYLTATLDPASALGFPFQVAEGYALGREGAGIVGRCTLLLLEGDTCAPALRVDAGGVARPCEGEATFVMSRQTSSGRRAMALLRTTVLCGTWSLWSAGSLVEPSAMGEEQRASRAGMLDALGQC